MTKTFYVADIGLDARTAGAEATYTYLAAPATKVGEAYFVPLGPRRVIGYVTSLRTVTAADLDFDVALLKPLGHPIQGLELPITTLETVREVARQTLTTLPMALSLAAPPGIKHRLLTTFARSEKEWDQDLTPMMEETLRVLESGPIIETTSKKIEEKPERILRALVKRDLVIQTVTLAPYAERQKVTGLLRLTPDSAAVERFLTTTGRKKPAQAFTLMKLQGSESAAFSVAEMKTLGGVSDQTIKALLAANLLIRVDEDAQTRREPPTPNRYQQVAIDEIQAAIRAGEPIRFLLYGITGSGKTEVYLRAAEEALRLGRQVLYLVPEIALTAQVIAQLRERFGRRVAVLHSNMTPTERMDSWMRVKSGDAPVILGPRSALFAPATNLGLIIMDEEHEGSYKQESSPHYHSKRIAHFLARQAGCPLVLGSATPSVETFFEAESGAIKLLRLPERAAHSAVLPAVAIEDLTEIYRLRKTTIFSEALSQAMAGALGRKEQIILFLNRRAYAPFLCCKECGHRFLCPNCAVSLSYHLRDRKLRCHHCDFTQPAPDVCPECQGTKVSPFGVGAERVEEATQTLFPHATVARLDRDVARIKGKLEEVLTKFRAQEIDILVGTQMVAKGLDFPNVTVVGVIAADISLNVPDFRASERTFQLLTQVAGRAGRGSRPGFVVIQTLQPDHISIQSAKEHEYEPLYRSIIEERRLAHYPPFFRLVNIKFTGEVRARVLQISTVAGQKLKNAFPLAEVLGPVDCSIERLNNQWRRHIVMKLTPEEPYDQIGEAIRGLADPKVSVVIDVDPYNML